MKHDKGGNILYKKSNLYEKEIQADSEFDGTPSIVNHKFTQIPTMLHSNICNLHGLSDNQLAEKGECPFDKGGTFLINGGEKVIVSQERMAENKVYCWQTTKDGNAVKNKNKSVAECEIKSSIDQRYHAIKQTKILLVEKIVGKTADKKVTIKELRLMIKLPFLHEDIDLFVVFRALGISKDEDIFKLILGNYIGDTNFNDLLRKSVVHRINLKTEDDKDDKDNADDENKQTAIKKTDSKSKRKTKGKGKGNGDDAGEGVDANAESNGNGNGNDEDQGQSQEYVIILTQDQAISYLSKLLKNTYSKTLHKDLCSILIDNLNKEFLPHCGTENCFRQKASLIGYMTNRLLQCFFKIRPYDLRDHLSNKRLDTAGSLLTKIYRTNLINLFKDLKKGCIKILTEKKDHTVITNTLENFIKKTIDSSQIESRLKYVLSTGNWSSQKNKDSTGDKGVAQVLSKLSYYGYLSHLRRIHSPLDSSGSKIIEPRKLHMTHYGMCCPNETPEGAQIGVVKNLAMQCEISLHTNDIILKYILSTMKNFCSIESLANLELINIATKIILNGAIVGVCQISNTNNVYKLLKTLKRHGIIHLHTSISWYIEWNEIIIQTDGGRYMRPLYIVNDEEQALELLIAKKERQDFKWNSSFRSFSVSSQGKTQNQSQSQSMNNLNGHVIEYLDSNEIENAMIALTYDNIMNSNDNKFKGKKYNKYNYCEIHPLMMLSVVAQMIPYSDHNQSPRNIYQSSMGKQSIGYFATNYNTRFDTVSHIQVYATNPLTITKTSKYTLLDRLPHGSTIMLALLSLGNNQEDAIIMNQDSVNRGLFNTIHSKTYFDTELKQKSSTANSESFTNCMNSDNIINKKKYNYGTIGDNGIPVVNTIVKENDIVIGKIVELKDQNKDNIKYKCISTFIKKHEGGFIDKIIPCNDPTDVLNTISNIDDSGNRFIKVKVSDYRKPEVGDKFASRHSQKGVVAEMKRSIDMPFDEFGVPCDIVMNPHGIPSRMTFGKTLEMINGNIAVASCKIQDATPFQKFSYEKLTETLEKYGHSANGMKTMYDGKTGKKYDALVYFCPTYYQRLKHMVIDKVHSRDIGPVQVMVRQPAEGRSRDGGHRFGEMERDAMLAHGAQRILKERMMDCSDIFTRYIDKTGTMVAGNKKLGLYKAVNKLLTKNDVTEIQIPYASSLEISEAYAMGIKMSIRCQ